MSLRGFVNNYASQLNGSITDVATAIVVDSDTLLNTILATNVDFVSLTIDDGTNIEIVHCTAADGAGNLTIVRGRESTSGTAFANNIRIQARLTSDSLQEINEWQPIDVQVLSGTAANVDFTVSAGTYKIVFDNVLVTATLDIQLQQGTGGGPTFQTTGYDYGGRTGNNASDAAHQAAAATQVVLFPGAVVTDPVHGHIEITDVGTSSKHTMKFDVGQLDTYCTGRGVRTTAEALTALRIKTSTSTFASGSKFILYKRNI